MLLALSSVLCVYCAAMLCRDELKRHYTLGEYWVEVEMEDLASFDEDLSDCLYKLPTENLPLVSPARIHTHTSSAALDQVSSRVPECNSKLIIKCLFLNEK